MSTYKLRGWVRASQGHSESKQRKALAAHGCHTIYVAGVDTMAQFVKDLQTPRPGGSPDIVLVSSLARLANSRDALKDAVQAIHGKGAVILEMTDPPRRSDDTNQLVSMMFDAADELAGERRRHSPEAAKKYSSKGGKARMKKIKAARSPAAEARAAWRDLSFTTEQVMATEALAGWTIRTAYNAFGKRNTARGVKIGRPRKPKA